MKVTLLFVLLCTSYLWFEAQACMCGPRVSPYREYQDSTAVFVGKVTSSKDIELTETPRDVTYTFHERVFQFSITESFKGPKMSTVDINMGRTDSNCFQGFTIGRSYLVYAFGKSEEGLHSGVCTRTSPISYAADDLHYIRELIKGVPEPRVYGSVMLSESDLGPGEAGPRITPVAGIKVVIEGKDKKFEVVTNEQGLYSLARIPDGKYSARPVLPAKYMAYFPTEEDFVLGSQEAPPGLRIQQGASAYAAFVIGWNNHLNGRIVDAEGNPVVRAKVSVLMLRSSSTSVVQKEHNDRHLGGEFRFYGLNPGKYLLSVEIEAPFIDNDRATTFYYPNANALDQAREISIGQNETVDDRDIRLPPGYLVRHIEGVLVWPNGVPVSGGWVHLSSSKNPAYQDNRFDAASSDEMGRFSLQAFVGAEYWVHGKSNASGSGEPIKIKVEMTNEPLKIVIPFPKRTEP